MSLRAYLRDASWWGRPNTSQPKKYHLSRDGVTPLCGLPAVLIERGVDPATLHAASRCKRCWSTLPKETP